MTLATVIDALQMFLSQNSTGGAACILQPPNGASISRNDIRSIVLAVARDDEVILVTGDPAPTTPQNMRMSAEKLLKQLASLPEEWLNRPVFISPGQEKIDEHYSVEFHHPVRNKGVVVGPEGELFLLTGDLSK